MPPKAKSKRKAETPGVGSSSSPLAKKPKNTPGASKKPTSFPTKISKNWTIAQLCEESLARGLDVGNVKHDKSFYLEVLGDGSMSVIAMAKASKNSKANSNKGKPGGSTKAPPDAAASKVASKAASKAPPKTPPKTPSKKKKMESLKAPKNTSASKGSASKKKLPSEMLSSDDSDTLDFATKAKSLKKKPTPTQGNKKKEPVLPTVEPKNVKPANRKKTPPKKEVMDTSATPPPTDGSYERITNKLTIAQLKDEAKARQLDPETLPRYKAELLHRLVEGSIYVLQSREYKAYQALLAKVQSEEDTLYEASLQKKQAAEARREELLLARQAKEEEKRAEEQWQKELFRRKEIEQQKSLHTHSFPRVHRHALANHKELMLQGSPRRGSCDHCDSGGGWPYFLDNGFGFSQNSPLYTCESCDWDICQQCFERENKSKEEKKRIRMERQRKAEEERRRQEEEGRREQEEEKRRWDVHKRFKKSIIRPSTKHHDINSKMKFTVWCSDGYDRGGWHSYEGEPDKEFDSVWGTKEEANDRAEYLFFWKNPWGEAPNLLSDEDGDPALEHRDGLKRWTVAPPDSSRWTVGVVPANAYIHLPNATSRRHNKDDGKEPKGYEEPVSFF